MRKLYDTSLMGDWRYIAGIDRQALIAISLFLGGTAMIMKEPSVLAPLIIIMLLLYRQGKRDQEFLNILVRHRNQSDYYSPHYMHRPNLRYPRPPGFNRLDVL